MKDIMTEAEARERWCPLARPVTMVDKGLTIPNRVASDMPMCIASDCMAWRLAHKPASNGDETGYCGAFGLPRFT